MTINNGLKGAASNRTTTCCGPHASKGAPASCMYPIGSEVPSQKTRKSVIAIAIAVPCCDNLSGENEAEQKRKYSSCPMITSDWDPTSSLSTVTRYLRFAWPACFERRRCGFQRGRAAVPSSGDHGRVSREPGHTSDSPHSTSRTTFPNANHASVREWSARSEFEPFAKRNRAAVPVIFQAILQIGLSLRSGQSDVAFDYLYTGRNVNLPDP